MEDGRLGQLPVPPLSYGEAEPERLQRVTAAGDPPVAEPETVGAEYFLGQFDDPALRLRHGWRAGAGRGGPPRPVGLPQQGGLVDLAVGVERQLGDEMDLVGAHVGGQAGRQVAVELLVGQILAEDNERQQFVGPLLARAARAHEGPLDRRVVRTRRSTSPGSILKPRTLTWRSVRPTYSTRPSSSARTRSPVR